MAGTPVISTNYLTCRFGAVTAVDRLTLTVYSGEVLGFLGHNGAGKTTTVRLLNGLLAPTEGHVSVLGLNPVGEGPALRQRTGVLTETPSLDERLTARENLTIYGELYNVPVGKLPARVEELLTSFELADRAAERVGNYSKGMKQRLALARALLHNPEILFLDEPTSGLDPVAARHVHELITRLSREQGHTIFLCTHNLVEAQQLCDRVAVLEHGRLLALGTPDELAHQLGQRLGTQIDVSPPTVAAALDALKAANVSASRVNDHGRILVSGADREKIPELIAALIAAGVRIYSVTSQEPSLEDVYFALHGEGLHQEAHA
jgi:ABC-2 type transport system ATP-binding protein